MLDPLELLDAGIVVVVGGVVVVVVVATVVVADVVVVVDVEAVVEAAVEVEVGGEVDGMVKAAGRVVAGGASVVVTGRVVAGVVGGTVGRGAVLAVGGTVGRVGGGRVVEVVADVTTVVVERAGSTDELGAIGCSGRGTGGFELPELHADITQMPSSATASQHVRAGRRPTRPSRFDAVPGSCTLTPFGR